MSRDDPHPEDENTTTPVSRQVFAIQRMAPQASQKHQNVKAVFRHTQSDTTRIGSLGWIL